MEYRRIDRHKKRATTFRIAVTPHTMKHYNLSLFKEEIQIIEQQIYDLVFNKENKFVVF